MDETAPATRPLLRDRVFALIRESPRPPTGLQILSRMRERGEAVHDSQIYRAVQQLCRSGAVRKIHLCNGYAVGGATDRISLLCRSCGSLASIEAPELVVALERLAARGGLAVTSYVLELPGLCARCAAFKSSSSESPAGSRRR